MRLWYIFLANPSTSGTSHMTEYIIHMTEDVSHMTDNQLFHMLSHEIT